MPSTDFQKLKPRYAIEDNFLSAPQHAALQNYILANEGRFIAAEIIRGGSHLQDKAFRDCLKLRDLGVLRESVASTLLEARANLARDCGIKLPEHCTVELELTAYGDGAHFARHSDVPVGPGSSARGVEPANDRLLSAVYYLHFQPKKFAGGDLRIFAWGDYNVFDDVEPVDNRLVAFPSWAEHQVMPVHSHSSDFRDFRFALNCWFCAA